MPRSPGLDPRLVKVRAGGRGSGWSIGTCGVVTARHVVAPFIDATTPTCLAVLDPKLGAATFDCDVVWDDAARDLALLKVRADQVASWQLALQGSRSPSLAEPGTDAVEVDAVGYPDATVERDLPQPDPVRGWLLPAGGAVSGRMPFDLITSVPAESSLWKGMSGSGVLLDGRLLGVVVEVDEQWASRRMYVSAFPDPAVDEVFARKLVEVGASPVVESFDAPAVRRMLAVVDPAGRPYRAEAVPSVGFFGARTARTDIDTLGDAYYPYVRRSIDDRLSESLGLRLSGADRRMLLIVGAAMTGKSRTGAESLRAHPILRSRPVLIPQRHANLREIESITPPGTSILWLDDLDEYLVRLDRDVLRMWQANPDLVVVATLRSDVLQKLMDKGELRSAWDLVTDEALVEQFHLGGWSDDDQRALEGIDPEIRDAVADGAPLGEVLGAAEELRKRFANAGERDRALVMVVADWARTGVVDPMDEQVARALWPTYLSPREARRIDQLVEDDLDDIFTASLTWACAGIADTGTALLSRTRRGLSAEDFIIGSRVGDRIADPIWQAALKLALDEVDTEPETLMAVGYYSAIANVTDVATRALTAVAAGGTGMVPLAQVNLAAVLFDQDPDRARELLESALATGDAEATPMAQASLGGLLLVDDPARARELLEAALVAGDEEVVPLAQANLAAALLGDDPARARDLLEAALASGSGQVVPLAQANLGGLLLGEDPVRARALLEAAVASRNGQVVRLAQANLGGLLLAEDPARARELLEAALVSGSGQVRSLAQANLGALLLGEDPVRARELLEEAVAAGNWQVLPVARANLAAVLIREDPERARELLEAVVASGNSQVLPMAQANLGGLLRREDPERARALLAEAAATPNRAAHASDLLGTLESEAGDPVAAAAAFEHAIALGDVYWSNVARLDFAAVLIGDDPVRARELMEAALAESDQRVRPSAQANLAALVIGDDPVRARELLESALASGDRAVGPLAQASLGGLLVAEDPVRARELLEAALTSGDGRVMPLAQANLAAVLMAEDPVRARSLLEEALVTGDRQVRPLAQANLSVLVLGEDRVRARSLLEEALVTGDRQVRPLAQANLAALLISEDPARSRELSEAALASGNSQVRPAAQANLGALLVGEDPTRARDLLEAAVATGSGQVLALARISLAMVVREDDLDRARELLEAAIQSGIGAAQASDLLGDLESDAGDKAAAAAAYERAIALDDPDWSAIARYDLAAVLADDDPARARELLETLITGRHENVLQLAQISLAMLVRDEEPGRARELFEVVIASGIRAAQACDLLGDLESEAGDPVAAEAAYQRCIALSEPYWSELARLNLAALIEDTDPGRAQELIEAVASSGESELAQVARALLDELLDQGPDH